MCTARSASGSMLLSSALANRLLPAAQITEKLMKPRFFFRGEIVAGEGCDAAMALIAAARPSRHDEAGTLHQLFVGDGVKLGECVENIRIRSLYLIVLDLAEIGV